MLKLSPFIIILLFFFSLEGISQELQLKISTIDATKNVIIDSLIHSKRFKDYNAVKTEVDSFQLKLFREGFINNKLVSFKKRNDSLFKASFLLNNKYESIHINYSPDLIEPSVINEITQSTNNKDTIFTIPFNKTESILNHINTRLTENGYPFTKIKLSEIEIKDEHNLKASLIVLKNETQRSLDKIILKGYEKFPKSFLKRYLKIKPKKTFNIASINKKIETLRGLKFANQIRPPEALFTKDSTILYLYLEKKQSNSFDGFLGFNTNEDTNKLEFNGFLNLELNNNFNFGESLGIIYKSDENEQITFEANLNTPYILGSPIGAELGLNLFRKDSTFSTVNQQAKLYYQLNSTSKIFGGIEFSESTNLLNQDVPLEIQDYKSNFYTISFNFERRNRISPLFPLQSGFILETGFGDRVESGNRENQIKIATNIFHIFNLNAKNSIYSRLNGSWLTSDSFLENELYRFGGINSIRGFEENTLTANLFTILNTEYRYKLNSNIYVHSIIDLGYFENALSQQQENLFGFGFGFGLITKSGLLKFNFANGRTQEQQFKFSNSKIHISLVALF